MGLVWPEHAHFQRFREQLQKVLPYVERSVREPREHRGAH